VIPHINDRLNNWARWAELRLSGALGYPKQAAFTKLACGGGRYDGTVIIDDDAWEIERAVCALDLAQRRTVAVIYRATTTTDQAANILGCSRATLYRRIDALHQAILDWLLDYYAGRGDGQGERSLRRALRPGEAGAGASQGCAATA
jgi:DNA-directed RNA polymerase specialized sigma24 family protein